MPHSNDGFTLWQNNHRSGTRKRTAGTWTAYRTVGWRKLIRYLPYRLRDNLKMLPVGQDVMRRLERGSDNICRVKTR